MMTKFSFDIVGFDLDGTLLDTSGDLAAAVNHALAAAGRPALTVEQVRANTGGGVRHMLELSMAPGGGCSEAEFNRLVALLLAYYEAHIAVESRPFPGAIEAIDALRAGGVKIAIVTNKVERLAVKLLDALGLGDRFDLVIGGDTLGDGLAKPHRAPIDEMIRRCGGGRAAFVGDSRYDIAAAKNAGIPSIAVSFPPQPAEELGANAVIHSYGELIPTLERLTV